MHRQQEHWLVVLRRLGLAACLFALLPCGFLFAYIGIFGAPVSAIAPHLCVVASFFALQVGLRLGIGVLPIGQNVRTAISSFVIVGTGLASILFYSLVFIGLTHWKRVTTFDMASSYALQLPDLLKALGYSPLIAGMIYIILIFAAWYFVYSFLKKHDGIAPLHRKISFGAISLASPSLLAIALVSAIALPDRDWGRFAEPLSLSLFPSQAQRAMQSHAIDVFRSAKIDHDENIVRSAYRSNEKAKRRNVIVIVSDALRADHLSLFGYPRKTTPNLEALHKSGRIQLASSALAVCNESSCGLRAFASSRYVDGQAAHPITLHEVLKRHGYQVNLVFSGDHTNFDGLSSIYGKVDSYFDGASQSKFYLNDDRLVTDRLQSFGPWNGVPTMFQFHLMSSHALGQRFEETLEFGPGDNYTGVRWGSKNSQMPQRSTNFYDRGILQADNMIADILKILDAKGYLRDALVLITGDHGESLGERGLYSHTHSVWEESLRVPLIFLSYGNAVTNMPAPSKLTSQIDIAPTILDLLEIAIPASWEGQSILHASQDRVIYFQQSQFVGLLDGRLSGNLYKHWSDTKQNQEFTFNLLSDPHEKSNITSETDQLLLREWRELLKNRSAALAPETTKRLYRTPRLDGPQ